MSIPSKALEAPQHRADRPAPMSKTGEASRGLVPTIAALVRQAVASIDGLGGRHPRRQRLPNVSDLGDNILRDIGLTRDQVDR